MLFKDINQVKREFGITCNEPVEVRKALRSLQSQIHPDRNDGHFKSDEEKKQYSKIEAAIDFLDSQIYRQSHSLVPLNEVREMIHSIKEILVLKQETETQQQTEAELAKKIHTEINKSKTIGLAPKVTSTVLTSILTFIWAFPGLASKHPMLSNLTNPQSPTFTYLWLSSLAITMLIWLLFSIIHQKSIKLHKKLSLETFQNDLFFGFWDESSCVSRDQKEIHFYKNEFIDYLKEELRREKTFPKLLNRYVHIEENLIEDLANLVLMRAEQKGMIRQEDDLSIGLDDRFIFLKRC